MQTRSSDENSDCLSVRLSVKCVHCDKTEERSVQIFIPPSALRASRTSFGAFGPSYVRVLEWRNQKLATLVKLTALERKHQFSIYFCL